MALAEDHGCPLFAGVVVGELMFASVLTQNPSNPWLAHLFLQPSEFSMSVESQLEF